MYFFLIFYLIFLIFYLIYAIFITYYSFAMGIGKRAKIGFLIYGFIISVIIIISLILLKNCQWGWNIPIPHFD